MALPAVTPVAAWNDDHVVPDELVGRLYRAGENAVLELTATFSPRQRANLAAFCYRKAHLHGIGLAIAATCDQDTLTQVLGTALGTVLFGQSRERPEPARTSGSHRAKITLAKLTSPESRVVETDDLDSDEIVPEDVAKEIAEDLAPSLAPDLALEPADKPV
jgi:hypothetical protein